MQPFILKFFSMESIQSMNSVSPLPSGLTGIMKGWLNINPVDGDFGPVTRYCVTELQRAKNIGVDGIVGTQTWTFIVTT